MKGRMDRFRRIIDGFCDCGKFNKFIKIKDGRNYFSRMLLF